MLKIIYIIYNEMRAIHVGHTCKQPHGMGL